MDPADRPAARRGRRSAAARAPVPWALPVAFGLVLGAGLVLVEHAAYWVFYFVRTASSYTAGPALWCSSWAPRSWRRPASSSCTRSPLAGRPPVRTDWRVACALVVVACAVWFLVAGPETDTAAWWLALYEGTLLLGAAALPVTLLWLRSDQRTAALVAITLFGLWSAYFIVRELVDPQLDVDPSVWRVELVSVVLTLLACFAAQAGPARAPSAGPSDQGGRSATSGGHTTENRSKTTSRSSDHGLGAGLLRPA